MGIDIGITVSSHIPEKKWEEVYQEAFDLAKKLSLATSSNELIHGHEVRCLIPTRETFWNDRQGWWAVADYEYGDECEGFFFPKKLWPPESDEPIDILSLRAHHIDVIELKKPNRNYQEIWGNKTQGHYYHYSLLAIGCLVQNRLGDDALVHGSINAGQCREAVERANKHLQKPIQIPYQCDPDRWFERVGRLDVQGVNRIRIAIDMFLGKENAAFGERLRITFSHEDLTTYWKEEFSSLSMEAMGFRPILKAYLTMGFSLDALGSLVPPTDEDGNDQRAKLVRMVMDAKLHWKEKDCSDIMEEDPDDSMLYPIEAMFVRGLGMGLRNRKVDRYIPIEELRRLLQKGFIGFDVNPVIDACLEEEASEEYVQEEGIPQFLNASKEKSEKDAEEYDIYVEHLLQFYEPGFTMKPQIEKNLRYVFDFSRKRVEEDDIFQKIAALTVWQQGEFLVEASKRFPYLRDRDWERIFKNLDKDPNSINRYASLFSIVVNDERIRQSVYALVVNDELYAYVGTLPSDAE